ncbi:MAG: 50S ribosomal protein L24 [Pirellulaceae bacterium]|nr:MAG: 50S ribosomal protein L24 [Pirellulaceae bacterium]
MKIRVDDEVVVITGVDKGKRGKVLKVDRRNGKVIVEGVRLAYKHVRRTQKNPQGGRLSREMPIDVSDVMLICPETGKPTRVGVRYLADGSKERYAKRSGASLGIIAPPRQRYAKQQG